MASSSNAPPAAGPNTDISIKIHAQGATRKLKLPLKELVPSVLPHKLRTFLGVHQQQVVVFERFSDSSANYVSLDANNVQAYKTLYRAARAKLKLRLRAHIGPMPNLLTSMNTLTLHSATGNAAAAHYVDTIQSLANLNFGSTVTLNDERSQSEAPMVPPSPPAAAITAEPVIAERPPVGLAHETVAAAVADFCQKQNAPNASSSTDDNSIEAKSRAFAENIREMDEELKLKIGAFKAHQATLTSSAALLATTKAKESHAAIAKESRATIETKSAPQQSKCPALRMSQPPKIPEGASFTWSVYCNHCNKNMLKEHFHCNTCENGDYDLCTDCMAQGKHCLDEKHWLIKRFLRGGHVINGETHKVASSPKVKSTGFVDMPGAFNDEKKSEDLKKPTRTCNCCVRVLCEDDFVNCKDCNDYDSCLKCLQSGEHGHHPAHTFVPATDLTKLSTHAQALCKPGRNITHAALCDECDSRIVGVRYKCLVCPDWDYCSTCMEKSPRTHKGHRFAPVYDSISPQSYQWAPTHTGVYCDGPLCKDKNVYITGIRYKCAVCADVDFCAGCEALPQHSHNKTHPLLKFRTPVRGCSVTTLVGDEQTRSVQQDHVSKTQICTVAEVKPTECSLKLEDPVTKSAEDKKPAQDLASSIKQEMDAEQRDLQAHFTRETIPDGTVFEPGKLFVQVWTLRNPGPEAWPAGCSVRYVGGDNMLNIDEKLPSDDSQYAKATESNVLRRTVEPGEEIYFRVLMKAPKREGVAISYWRLKTADGTPFGHRLWCHIVVSSKSEKAEQAPEIGRLGAHDAFLRYSLNEHVKKGNQQKPGAAEMDLVLRNIAERLRHLSNKSRESGGDGVPLEPTKSEKVKIEVVESTDMPSVKKGASSNQKLSFPVLDVESSTSSVESEQITTNAAAVENVPAVAPAPAQHDATIFDDAESITVAESIDLSEDNSSDDGFMTEDEYDILDASDHELV